MICLRCGICCTTHMVVIVKDPELGPIEDNLVGKESGQRCPHLRGEEAPFTCAVHDYPWYPKSPCGTHGQMERHADELCRLGNFHLNGVRVPERRLPTCSS